MPTTPSAQERRLGVDPGALVDIGRALKTRAVSLAAAPSVSFWTPADEATAAACTAVRDVLAAADAVGEAGYAAYVTFGVHLVATGTVFDFLDGGSR